ncbi:MAG TPA: hypothetical protein VKG91_03060, partial [Roseiarcus sp.]|nr:hypothetical protein [Roseiarcus sp.]
LFMAMLLVLTGLRNFSSRARSSHGLRRAPWRSCYDDSSRSRKRKARLFQAIALATPIAPRRADLSNRVAPKYALATVVQAQARRAVRTEIAHHGVHFQESRSGKRKAPHRQFAAYNLR